MATSTQRTGQQSWTTHRRVWLANHTMPDSARPTDSIAEARP